MLHFWSENDTYRPLRIVQLCNCARFAQCNTILAMQIVLFITITDKKIAVCLTFCLINLYFKAGKNYLSFTKFSKRESYESVHSCFQIVEAVKYLNYFASVFFLTAMSVDRYIAVVYVASSNKWRTSRNTFIVRIIFELNCF